MNAIVTGATSGIGEATAIALAEKGYNLIITGRRVDRLRRLKRTLEEEYDIQVEALCFDVRDQHQCAANLENLPDGFERIDLLVNNASVFFRPGSAEDLAAGKLYRQLNYLTPKRLLEAFYDQKLSEGAAVNMVDSAVLRPGGGAYYESKKALAELTVALSRDFGSCNLRINAIAPGAVLPPHWAPDSPMTKVLSENFLHRAVKCEDLADLALFMLKCDSLTGTVIPLDCGISR